MKYIYAIVDGRGNPFCNPEELSIDWIISFTTSLKEARKDKKTMTNEDDCFIWRFQDDNGKLKNATFIE